MATLLYSSYEPWPQDTGYVIRRDRYDDGSVQSQAIGVADQPAGSPPVNFSTLITRLRNAQSNVNQTYLGLTNPSNAQNTAQIQALTKEVNALIQFLLHELTGINSIPGT